MLLMHGTGREAAGSLLGAIREGKDIVEHDIVWHNSRRDWIYFWGEPGEADKDAVNVKQETIIRAAESAMYTKAIAGSRDKDVCVIVFALDDDVKECIRPDPDADGLLPAFYMTVSDFNRCIHFGKLRLLTAVYGGVYRPEQRWEYLAVMRAGGRKFPGEGIADDQQFWDALKHILFGDGAGVVFERLFTESLKQADWKLLCDCGGANV